MLNQTVPGNTESDFVVAFQQGQPEVLALLYDKYAPVLMGLISRILGDQDQAETVLQQTFLQAWHERATYNPEKCRLLTWMIMLARDAALAALPPERIAPPGVKVPWLQSNGKSQASASLEELLPAEKSALDLVYLHGYPCADAAALLGVSEEDLKACLRHACQKLRKDKPV